MSRHASAAHACASSSKAWSCSGRSASSHRRPESDSSKSFVESVPAAYNAHNYAHPRYGTRRNHMRAGHWSSSRGVRSRTEARRGSSHRWPADPVLSCTYHLKGFGAKSTCARWRTNAPTPPSRPARHGLTGGPQTGHRHGGCSWSPKAELESAALAGAALASVSDPLSTAASVMAPIASRWSRESSLENIISHESSVVRRQRPFRIISPPATVSIRCGADGRIFLVRLLLLFPISSEYLDLS